MLPSIGIDVHKETLVVADSTGATWEVPRDAAGLATLIHAITQHGCSIVVVEPSGGYEQVILAACWDADIPIARVNAYQLRAYARGEGLHAKTDRMDAHLLVRFADHHRPPPLHKPDIIHLRVRSLIRARDQVMKTRLRVAHQAELATADTRDCFERLTTVLTAEIGELSTRITTLLARSGRAQRISHLLTSVPGIAIKTASMLVAEVLELGCVESKHLACLLGVVPITHQSGTSTNYGHIHGGRAHVRSALYLPTISAMTHNPVIRAFANRLRHNGKRGKVVVIACMHKLLTIINAMVRNDQLWESAHPTP